MTRERGKLVHDYVNDNYVPNISDLRNDYMFMIDVINYTKDRSIYFSCSEEVKCNYDFVKFLINKFKDKKQFICYVVDKYINNVDEEDMTRFELLIMFCDILNSLGIDYDTLTYNIKKLDLYKKTMGEIFELINDGKIDNFESGLGFSYVVSKYGNSDIICDYFAHNFITEIFYNTKNLRLEDLLHKMFSTKEDLLKYGIYDFILDYVGCYDKVLAIYLSDNKKNIKKIESSIINIINNWDNYVVDDRLDENIDSKYKYIYDVVCLNSDRIFESSSLKKIRKY